MGDKARSRENWGQSFRQAVSSGKGLAIIGTAVFAVPLMVFTEGLPQYVGVIAALFALVSAHPKSPLIPAVVHWLPKLPRKGNES